MNRTLFSLILCLSVLSGSAAVTTNYFGADSNGNPVAVPQANLPNGGVGTQTPWLSDIVGGVFNFSGSGAFDIGGHVVINGGSISLQPTGTGDFQGLLTAANNFTVTGLSSLNGALNVTQGFTNVSYMIQQGGVMYATNQGVVPDFSVPVKMFTTNGAFTLNSPIGRDTSIGKNLQTTVMYVKGDASARLITPPANCAPVPATGMYVTNLTRLTFEWWPGEFTNCFAVPIR